VPEYPPTQVINYTNIRGWQWLLVNQSSQMIFKLI